MPTWLHSIHSVLVSSSTPSLAAITNSAQSAARSPARSSPTKSAYPGVSIRLTLIPSCCSGRQRQSDRALRCDLRLIAIADGGALDHRAGSGEHTGGDQKGLDECRLAATRWAHQHHVADGGRTVRGGGGSGAREVVVLSAMTFPPSAADMMPPAGSVNPQFPEPTPSTRDSMSFTAAGDGGWPSPADLSAHPRQVAVDAARWCASRPARRATRSRPTSQAAPRCARAARVVAYGDQQQAGARHHELNSVRCRQQLSGFTFRLAGTVDGHQNQQHLGFRQQNGRVR